MSEAKEPESSPRMRWFQFDLRLLFVLLTAVGVILALEIARRSDGGRPKGLTSTIRAGDQVVLSEHQHGFEITRQKGVVSHTVTEVGTDYVRLKSIDGPVSLIPLEKIYRIIDDPRPYGAATSSGGMGGMPPGGMGGSGGVGSGAAGFGPASVGIMGPGGPGGYGPATPGGGSPRANGAVPIEVPPLESIAPTVPTEVSPSGGGGKP